MKELATTIDINAPADTVWNILIDFPRHAEWNPFFASIEGTAEVGSQLKIAARKGDGSPGMRFSPVVLDVKPAELLRWKGKLLVPGIFDGTHTFRLESLPDERTRLHHGEQFRGILVPLMSKVVSDTERGFDAFNRAIAEQAEAAVSAS